MSEDTRTILRISGPEARDFLQGLVTNDVSRLDAGLVYAALLTPKGKYIADFFLVPEGDAVLLDVDSALAPDVARRLAMYKLRSKVEIAETDRTVTRGLGTPPEGAFADPRDASLGWRGYDGQPGDADVDWTALHVAACVPRSGIELSPDTFILEAGFDRLSGVDFRKGCYVGQEVTARMRHKTELRKGFATVEVEGEAPVGTEILAGEKAAGALYSQAQGRGIAYLRFDRAGRDMQAGPARVHYQP
ncbi:CAF17-like 4Fe-4S cluster assembly/insertion protein YgfZ [Citreimonas sp.]|uniref:CAF17-like 4Fe-4S cluster assembly/insertion protein YgfZ n=1 Tax=Citreimonas sp. TaxID=3036715 RepID=UPI004058356A